MIIVVVFFHGVNAIEVHSCQCIDESLLTILIGLTCGKNPLFINRYMYIYFHVQRDINIYLNINRQIGKGWVCNNTPQPQYNAAPTETHHIISSTEPKAHRWAYRIGRHPSSSSSVVRPQFQRRIFLKLVGRSWSNLMWTIIGLGDWWH